MVPTKIKLFSLLDWVWLKDTTIRLRQRLLFFFKENWDEGDEKNEDLESEESEQENESETFDEEGWTQSFIQKDWAL